MIILSKCFVVLLYVYVMFVSILYIFNKESILSGDVKLKYAFFKLNKICLFVYLYFNKRLKILFLLKMLIIM